jgi:hypothetical protein
MWRRNASRALLILAVLLTTAACVDQVTDTPAADTAEPSSGPALAVGPRGSLLWFGYAGEDTLTPREAMVGTASYVNWGHVIAPPDFNSDSVTRRINALGLHNQKALVELGPLLWKDTLLAGGVRSRVLHADYRSRFTTWRTRNSAVLTVDRVIGFQIADEPHHNHIDMAKWDEAAAMVKQAFPWAPILMIEAPTAVMNPATWRGKHVVQKVDWVGLDLYTVKPDTSTLFRQARDSMRARYPGKRWAYVADGFYGQAHVNAGLTLDGNLTRGMGQIMRDWYAFAAADPAAILLGVFIWPTFGEGTGSRDFPPSVLAAHAEVGRAITGRARAQTALPVGVLDSVSAAGWATGWACDPDAAWGEAVRVDLFVDGVLSASTTADQPNQPYAVIPQCRSGTHRRFRVPVMAAGNQRVTAVAHDLNAGSTTLPWSQVFWVQPSGVTWGPPNTLTVAGLAGNGTGGVQMTWRDRTANGPWTTPAWAPAPSPSDGSWSNTIPTSNYCHDYDVFVTYAGGRSRPFAYLRATSGHCVNKLLFIQTQPLMGFGPPGSLVVSGNLKGAPQGSGVQMFWRNVTINGPWTPGPYVPTTLANGDWYNHIPNANYGHRYDVYSRYDGGMQTAICTYVANSGRSNC